MKTAGQPSAGTGPQDAAVATDPEIGQIGQNIAAVHEFYAREGQKRSASQRHAEMLSDMVGRPAFLVIILVFVTVWMAANLALPLFGQAAFDEPPFFWLQGIVGLAALLTATVVLAKQNRFAKLSDQRAHLDLKVTLLIEQKTAKLIDLIEELRRDLPNVKNRQDDGAAVLQQALSPERVLAALDEPATSAEGSISPAAAANAATTAAAP